MAAGVGFEPTTHGTKNRCTTNCANPLNRLYHVKEVYTMENYEEMLLQITDVLKAHNRYHMKTPDHKQAIEQIRAIVFPKGKEDPEDVPR